jgi:wyosine [tRNA(Phe)-imidazoG37] synthetase (radical SAM superfamily)
MMKIFGPVPSRRLGLSLGVDVLPYKTCSFNCVYCECGATTDLICERRAFCPVDEVLGDLELRLSHMKDKPDAITLSGSGEPTLYSGLGELITSAKRAYGIPVAVITNSSLLFMPDVREELMGADIVLPSLDAAIEESYRRINRPHERCSLARTIEGIEMFLAEYRGRVLFEILLIDGYNTDERNLTALKRALERLRVDSIQLNTAVRPGSERGIEPLGDAALEEIRHFFGPRCDVIASAQTTRRYHEEGALEETIIGLLSRRPCTAFDVYRSTGIPPHKATEILLDMVASGLIVQEAHGTDVFYTAAKR